ncbi:hypothetical protein TWF481_009303 [Arthrobotrys musiformis]|uniref:Yeast cell wall synthesis Kre9/Knh1-like N-terminal domain-containing protein n=1 Tax=Arthrobotrys musiformis TaxID=47236 RepID=A0AAV9W3C9_9PEZI
MFTAVFTTLLALSASALAYTTPTTYNQTSNPIGAPLSVVIPAGKPFKIEWTPTESGTVSIILLRGPSENILPLYPIVEKIPNSGSYSWTPKTDLEPDTTHYGIQLIIDANGQYQYSNQFGISNPDYEEPATTTSAAATTSAVATTSSYGSEETTTSFETVYTTTKSSVTSFITVTTSSIPYEEPATTSTSAPSYTYVPPVSNTTSVAPSGTSQPTISSALPPVPSQTGAASSIKVASGLLMGVAGVAAMLL